MIGAAKTIVSTVAVSSFEMFVAPATVNKLVNPGAATSISIESYPSNGVEPYAYLWTQLSGDAMTINGSTGKSVTFTTSGSAGDVKSAVFQCEVTDASLATKTDTVNVGFIFKGDIP